MKNILFFILVHFIFCTGNAHVSYPYYYSGLIPPGSHILYGQPGVISTPPLMLELKDIQPALQPGVWLYLSSNYIREIGPAFFYFTDSSGNKLGDGGFSTDPSNPYHGIYQINSVYYYSNGTVVEKKDSYIAIPVGAVKLYISSSCGSNCLDKTDPTGKYSISLGTMDIDNSIRGIVKKGYVIQDGVRRDEANFNFGFLGSPIKANKTAEFGIETLPNLDVTGTKFKIGSLEYSPRSNVADGSGNVIFDVVVPYARSISYTIEVRGKNNLGVTKEIATYSNSISIEGIFNILAADIYQVIKNPILFAPSTTVDLVAGKNADIIIKTDPNTAFVGSTIEWKNKTSTVTKYFGLEAGVISDANGNLTFKIDPVPADTDFVGGPTQLTITLKSFDIISNQTVTYGVLYKDVYIRKTKPIKIGFVQLKSKNKVYPDPSAVGIGEIITKGIPYLKLLYPVAEGDVTWVESFLPVWGIEKPTELYHPTYEDDMVHLNDLVGKKVAPFSKVDRVVGFASNNYFDIYHRLVGTRGISYADQRPVLLSSSATYQVLSHELAHTYCLRYDGQSGCNSINNLNGHSVPSSLDITGYSNKTVSELPKNQRGFLFNRKNLMDPTYDSAYEYLWFSEHEYLSVFRNLLNLNKTGKADFLNLTISGSLIQDGTFVNSSIYLSKNQTNAIFSNDGDYQVEAYTKLDQKIFEARFFPKSSFDELLFAKLISIDIPYQSNLYRIKIYKINSDNSKTLVTERFVVAEILKEAVSNLSDESIIGDPIQVRENFSNIINKIDFELSRKNISGVENFIKGDIQSLMNTYVKNVFNKQSLLETSKFDLVDASIIVRNMLENTLDSSNRADSNSFVKIELKTTPVLNSKVGLDIKKLRNVENQNQLMVVEVFYDNQKICFDEVLKCNSLDSYRLNAGVHAWSAKVFLVDKKSWVNYNAALSLYKKEFQQISTELGLEIDPSKIQILLSRQEKIQSYIQSIESFKQSLKLQIDKNINFTFEVLNK